ncbi:MAG: 50S ribosomal protein L32e [Candidatus Woesearchaeota archaeon]|nr:50S ribosomal protein L32e [Candidatus Woesearchaeota archaeon]
MDIKRLLEVREKIRKKKPKFIRQDAHKIKRLEKKWRKPKGVDSKMRHKRRGYRRSVEVGWRSPKKVRGLHRSGLKMVNVANLKDLKELDPKKHIIIISRVGKKKKIKIVKQALEKNFEFVNLKNPKEFLDNTNKELIAAKKRKEKEEKKKEKKKEKPSKKESIEDVVKETDDEKSEEKQKEKKKKEKDKLLTKRR